jgi:hypothetical protein
MKLQIMKLPTQYLLNENLEFINMGTCLVLEKKGRGGEKNRSFSSYHEHNI